MILVRHAPVLDKSICYGRWDVEAPFSESDVRRLCQEILSLCPSPQRLAWYSSPRTRALHLAQATRAELSESGYFLPELMVEEDLSEMDMGVFEGRPFAELIETAEYMDFMEHWQEKAPPQGESLRIFQSRVGSFWDQRKTEDSIVFAHAGVIRALRVIQRGISWEDAMEEPVPHATALVL